MEPFKDGDRPSENVYYLASSAVQKCIRRGHDVAAINFAKVMWKMWPFKTWKRMWIWLSEDCCRNVEALRLFKEPFDSRNFSTMVPIIRALARGPKDRTGASLSHLMRLHNISPIMVHNLLKDQPVHKQVLEFCKTWDDRNPHKYAIYDGFDFAPDRDWVIDVAEKGDKFDFERFILAIPYFFIANVCTESEADPIDECEPCTFWDDWLPLEAIDGHTRPGQAALGTYCKHKGFPELKVNNSRGLKPVVFFNEGWLARKYQPYEFDFMRLLMDHTKEQEPFKVTSGYYEPWVRDYCNKEVLPELHNVRDWVLRKMFADDMKRFKLEYLKDLIA